MACGSCGSRRTSTSSRPAAAGQSSVQGYEYTPPGGGEVQVFLTPFEAKKAQRRHGGGTIVTLKKG